MPADNPSPVLYLHIGTPKTGTATLQALFHRNRDLLARNGLCYPSAPGESKHIGLMLYAAAQGRNMPQRALLGLRSPEEVDAFTGILMDRLRAEIAQSGCAKVLMSSEHLSSDLSQASDVRKLVDDLRQICPDIRVVVYLRPQYELVLSGYSQAVKAGHMEPLKVELGEDANFYNYDIMLDMWEQALGIQNIRVRLFHHDAFADGSLIADFFRTIDMAAPAGLDLPGTLNPSLDAHTLEFARTANAVVWREERAGSGPWLTRLLSALERISTGPKFIAAGAELAALDHAFQASNAAVANRYFPNRHGVLFPPFNKMTQSSIPPLTTKKVVELTIALWQEANERTQRGPAERRRKGRKNIE